MESLVILQMYFSSKVIPNKNNSTVTEKPATIYNRFNCVYILKEIVILNLLVCVKPFCIML